MSASPFASPQELQDELTVPVPQPKRKSGGNRMPRMLPDGSELVWPEELESALFEALAIYPPVISRRGATTYSDSGDPIELGHNIGRCQLIQEYIQKKTGKIRSRKQVASRLQRLRQTYKDDARMMALLRSARKSPGEDLDRSPSVANVETQSAHQLENKVTPYRAGLPIKMGSLLAELNGNDSDDGLEMAMPLLPHVKMADWESSPTAGNVENAPPSMSSAPWAFWPHTQPPSNSMSRRRLASNIPALRVQVDLPPASSFLPRPTPIETAPQVTGNASNHLCVNSAQMSNPATPLDQIFHTPEHPPELRRPQRRSSTFSEYGHSGSPPELAQGYSQCGPPSPWSSSSSFSSVPSLSSNAADGGMAIYSGFRQQPPQIASNFSSPYCSPYPSPTMQTFPRSHTRIKFEETLHQAAPADGQPRHLPQIARNRSFQLPARHPVPLSANHSNQASYSHAPSPLSSSHSMELPSLCTQGSQSLEMVGLHLPPTHSFDGSMSRALSSMELASPVAIRPFFFNEILSERSSPEISTSGSTTARSGESAAFSAEQEAQASGSFSQIRPPVLLEDLARVKDEEEACMLDWPADVAVTTKSGA